MQKIRSVKATSRKRGFLNINTFLNLNINLNSQVVKEHIHYFRFKKKQDEDINS